VASSDAELAVLEEFAQVGPQHGLDCRMLTAAESRRLNPYINADYCRGSLLATEVVFAEAHKRGYQPDANF